MAKIITFGTLKGGVGKTMLCFNVAGALAQKGKKVLLLDCDLQGNLTNNIGVERTDLELRTAYDIFNVEGDPPTAEELIYRRPIAPLKTLDIIPGSMFLHQSELKISTVAGREQLLKNFFEDNAAQLKRYDYVLIDTNPSMSIINQNAFLVSDSILLVSDVSMNALEGAQLFMALWDDTRKRLRAPNNVKGFIINDFDKRNKLSLDYLEFLKTDPGMDEIRSILFDTVIPRNIKITESEMNALPIVLYDPKSKGSEAIYQLIAEMKKRGVL